MMKRPDVEPAGRLRSRRETLRITAVAGLGIALSGGLTAELLRRGRLHRVRVTRASMGTNVTITVIHEDRPAAHDLAGKGFAEITRLERILSRQQRGTAIHRLNEDGFLPDPPGEVIAVLTAAEKYSRLTNGAFDITVAPLIDLYAMRFAATGQPPAAAEIRVMRERIDWRAIGIDGSGVTLDGKGVALSVDGIAKGYVVDRSVEALQRAGAGEILIGASGDMAGTSGASWRVAIRDPREPAARLGIVRLQGGAVASSGDYMQAFSPDRRYHHIIDPRTGVSPDGTCGVTVVAPTAMDADALSTAALVLGPRDGLAMIRQHDGAEALIASRSGEIVTSDGFGAFVDRSPLM